MFQILKCQYITYFFTDLNIFYQNICFDLILCFKSIFVEYRVNIALITFFFFFKRSDITIAGDLLLSNNSNKQTNQTKNHVNGTKNLLICIFAQNAEC